MKTNEICPSYIYIYAVSSKRWLSKLAIFLKQFTILFRKQATGRKRDTSFLYFSIIALTKDKKEIIYFNKEEFKIFKINKTINSTFLNLSVVLFDKQLSRDCGLAFSFSLSSFLFFY